MAASDVEDVARLFTAVHGKRMKNNRPKLKQESFQWYIRKKVFLVNRLPCWKRLPREAVQSPSLEVFRTDWIKP